MGRQSSFATDYNKIYISVLYLYSVFRRALIRRYLMLEGASLPHIMINLHCNGCETYLTWGSVGIAVVFVLLIVFVAPKEFIIILRLEDSNNIVIGVAYLDILILLRSFIRLPGQMKRHVG